MSFSLNCENPTFLKKGIVVACGQCFRCRQKYKLQWQLRLQHELHSNQGKAIFLTLTYSSDHLPPDNELCKKDFQDFMKRFRKHYKYFKVKYFCAGEYGEKKGRPHFHAIIFGMPAPSNCRNSKRNFHLADFIAKYIWKKGFCHIGLVNAKTISYTAKYILKKYYSKSGENKKIQPFTLKSAGLGLQYLIDHLQYIRGQLEQNRPVTLHKFKIGYPRYYRKKLVDLGWFHEDFFKERYYAEMDSIQDSVIQELNEVGIILNDEKNYLRLSLSSLCNLDKFQVTRTKKVWVEPKGYKLGYYYDKPYLDSLSYEEEEDILKNHWFMIYVNYVKSKCQIKRKRFIDNNSRYFKKADLYE